MPLEFKNDAICLSGLLGTNLKSKIVHQFYELWWIISSGGFPFSYSLPTTIIEMNSGSGEIYIKETDEIILGSAGYALELKFNSNYSEIPNLDIILVEENEDCITHLKNVIKRRFPRAEISEDFERNYRENNHCILISNNPEKAVNIINENIIVGKTIYFFDPLLSIDMEPLKKIYDKNVGSPSSNMAAFIIFFFTSIWITGRNDLTPLPTNSKESNWTIDEKDTINKLNRTLGDKSWQSAILKNDSNEERIERLIKEYQDRLFKLFRFVIPMAFTPNKNQVYHLIFCANYLEGSSILRSFYEKFTFNKWKPMNTKIYKLFQEIHKFDINFPKHPKRPLEWKLLWNFIKNYRFGKMDILSKDVKKIESDKGRRQKLFDWLLSYKYINEYRSYKNRGKDIRRYELNWDSITNLLKIPKPEYYKPFRDEEFLKKKKSPDSNLKSRYFPGVVCKLINANLATKEELRTTIYIALKYQDLIFNNITGISVNLIDLRGKRFTIKVDKIEKVVIHNCEDFRELYQYKKLCKHLLYVFIILERNYKKSYNIFIDSFIKDLENWNFKIKE